MINISIIVPVYNVEKYLKKCIDSILAQTYKEFEVILVNDGSTDKSGEICEEYSKKDNRIRVIHKKNGGLSSARNAGIDIAIGKYIGFIDSDDWIDGDMFKLLYNLVEEYNAQISECQYIKVTGYNEVEKQIEKENNIKICSNIEALKALYLPVWYGSVIACNKLFNKELFNDLRFPEGRLNEDQFIMCKLIYKAEKIVYIEKIEYFYFQSENSITRSNFSIKKLDAIEALKDSRDFYDKQGLLEVKKLHDKTYSFALLKYRKLLKREGLNLEMRKNITKEFDNCIFDFYKNEYMTYKEKIILAMRRILE